MRHGKGKMTFSNLSEYSEYDGNWREDFQHGNGNLLYRNGTRYLGSFLRSAKHGIGTLTVANGEIYVGGFVNDNIEGNGTYTY